MKGSGVRVPPSALLRSELCDHEHDRQEGKQHAADGEQPDRAERQRHVAPGPQGGFEVATWMGHSGQMALSTYLHVMSELGDERISAEEAIRRAREALVPSSYPRDADQAGEEGVA